MTADANPAIAPPASRSFTLGDAMIGVALCALASMPGVFLASFIPIYTVFPVAYLADAIVKRSDRRRMARSLAKRLCGWAFALVIVNWLIGLAAIAAVEMRAGRITAFFNAPAVVAATRIWGSIPVVLVGVVAWLLTCRVVRARWGR